MSNLVILLTWFKEFWLPVFQIIWDYREPISLWFSIFSLLFSIYVLIKTKQLEKELAKLIEDDQNQGVRFKFYLSVDGELKEIKMAEPIGVGGKAKIVVKVVDKFENEAKLDGVAQWKNLNVELGEASVAVDGLSAEVVSSGKMGLQTIELEGDADLGEGVKPIKGSVEIEWVAGEAVAFKTVVMKVEEVPPAPEVPPVPEA